MPEPFRGCIPNDRLYDPRFDMWVIHQDDGRVIVGATSFGLSLAGEIIMFTGKPKGAEVLRNKGLGTVETGKTILAVHSPVSMIDYECNEDAEENPQLINEDSYGKGWMAKGRAADWAGEHLHLIDATAYIKQVMNIDPAAKIDRATP